MRKLLFVSLTVFTMVCSQAQTTLPFDVSEVASFDEPWSMAFLPDGRILVAEKKGSLAIVGQDGESFRTVSGCVSFGT